MPRGLAVSSYSIFEQMAHQLRQRLITDGQIQPFLSSLGCAPLTSRQLGVAESSVSNTITGRSNSLPITRSLYNNLCHSARMIPELSAYIDMIAPPDVVRALELAASNQRQVDWLQLHFRVLALIRGQLEGPPDQSAVDQLGAQVGEFVDGFAEQAKAAIAGYESIVGS